MSSSVAAVPISRELHLVDQFLAVDHVASTGDEIEARRALLRLVEQLEQCSKLRRDPQEWSRCASRALFDDRGLRPAAEIGTVGANTLTGALRTGEGSCAALVAVALAATMTGSNGFDAVVLRDHVLLSSRSQRPVYFEVLARGQEVSEEERSRYLAPPGGPAVVGLEGYLPYYIDNVAARLVDAKRDREAEWAFHEAIRLGPKIGRIRYNYGSFLLQLGRYAEARDSLKAAIRLGWDDGPAWVNRGVAEWKLGNVREARLCFKQALKHDPTNREAATNLSALEESRRTRTH